MKPWILRRAIAISGFYFRHFPFLRGNRALFDRVVGRELRHFARMAPIEIEAKTCFGARMALRPHEFIDSFICFFGLWEPTITGYIANGLVRGDTFVDIGANVGYFSLLAAGIVGPEGHVYAIEASPTVFARLERNLALNSFRNITAKNVAVAGERARVSVYRHEGHNEGGTTIIASELGPYHRLEAIVDGLPLYDIVPWRLVETARFIKIDVEGAEWVVVRSIKDRLRSLSSRTEIILEVTAHAIDNSGGSIAEVVDAFDRAGFDAFQIGNTYTTGEYTTEVSFALTPFTDFNVKQADLIFKRRC